MNERHAPRVDGRILAGMALILAFVTLAPPSIATRLSVVASLTFPRNLAVALLILAAWGILLLALACASMSRPVIRWGVFALVAVSFAVMETYRQAVGAVMMFPDYLVLWNAREMAGDALSEYAAALGPALAWVGLLLLGFLLIRRRGRHCGWISVTCLVVSVGIFTGISYKKGGAATQLLPAPTSLYGLAASQWINSFYAKDYQYTYSEHPEHPPLVKNIVLIVDESIRSDFFHKVVAPRIRSNANWQVHDFGSAVSMSNCSGPTNLMLRKGVRFDNLESDIYEHGLIWNLAAQAGFVSYLLDAQSHGMGNNYVDSRELGMIGHVPTTDWADDSEILDSMNHLKGPERTFTYIIKMGAHFPYSSHYPADFSYTLQGDAPYMNNEKRKEYVDAIAYQTGRFFDKLMNTPIPYPTLIIYLSDHGQNVDDRPGKTHCDSAVIPSADQGVVPFVILTNYQDDFIEKLHQARSGKMSHFDVPPILRQYMGYDTSQYKAGKPDSPTVSSFVYGSPFGYFGSRVTLEHIDRERYQQLESERWSPRGSSGRAGQ